MLFGKDIRHAPMTDLAPIIKEVVKSGRSVKIYPRGRSMLPMIKEGRDSVTLSKIPSDGIKKYDVILYMRNNGEYILHRVVNVGETYTCVGDARFVLERGIKEEQIIAVVTSFTKKGKDYTKNSVGYKIYYRLRHLSRPLRRVCFAALRRIKSFLKRHTRAGKVGK